MNRFFFREQEKPGEILAMILKVGTQDTCPVYPSRNLAGDCSGTFDAPLSQHFDAAGRVVERNPLHVWMLIKEPPALRKCNRMRIDLLQIAERGSGEGDQIVNNPKVDLTHDVKIVFE